MASIKKGIGGDFANLGGLRPTPQPSITEYRPLLNLLMERKNNNKADSTINFTRKALTFLGKHANLSDLNAVKQFIAQMDAKNGCKHNLCISYNRFCNYYQMQWEMPIYRNEEREIVPPEKEKILMLIAEAHKTTSIKIQLSMETGLRPVELCRLIVVFPLVIEESQDA